MRNVICQLSGQKLKFHNWKMKYSIKCKYCWLNVPIDYSISDTLFSNEKLVETVSGKRKELSHC